MARAQLAVRRKKKTKETTEKIKEKTKDYIDKTKEKAKPWVEKAKESTKDWSEKFTEKTRSEYDNFKNTYGKKMADGLTKMQEKYGQNAASKFKNVLEKYGVNDAEKIKEIYDKYGTYWGEQIYNIYQNHGKNIANNIKLTIDKYGREVGPQLIDAYNRHKGYIAEKIHNAYDQYGDRVGFDFQKIMNQYAYKTSKYFQDKELQEKTINAALNTIVAFEKINVKNTTYKALKYATENIMIKGKNGKIQNLNNYAKDWINYNAPYLEGTTISKDPIEAFTYVVIFQDIDYVATEMEIVRDDNGQYCSITKAIEKETPINATKTLQMLDTINSFETLVDNDASYDDINAAANIIKNIKNL